MTELSERLDLSVDISLEYALATLAGGERLQPFASYEAAGEVTRAIFLGIGHPDPVEEARIWVAEIADLTYVVIVYPGEITSTDGRRQSAVLAEAWEPAMSETLVVAQPFEATPDGDPDLGTPAVLALGGQLELGTSPPLQSKSR